MAITGNGDFEKRVKRLEIVEKEAGEVDLC